MMRLERAAQLLEQDAGHVAEVAYRVGYRDADHFSKVFKQIYGVAPSAFVRTGDGGLSGGARIQEVDLVAITFWSDESD